MAVSSSFALRLRRTAARAATTSMLVSFLAFGPRVTPTAAGNPLPGQDGAADTVDRRQQSSSLKPADLLTHTQVNGLDLSSGGDEVLLVTSHRSHPDSSRRTVASTVDVETGAREVLSLPEGARDPAWRPGTGEVSYLAPRDGRPQVWLLRADGDPVPITDHERGVRGYRWSPDGERLALTVSGPGTGSGDQSAEPRSEGVEVDPAWIHVKRLFRDDLRRPAPRPKTQLWATEVDGGGAAKVSGRYSVTGYAWAPGSSRLAFTGRAEARSRQRRPVWRSDLFLTSVRADTVRTLLAGRHGVPFRGGGYFREGSASFRRPVWGPEGDRIAVVRSESDSASTVRQLGLVDLEDDAVRYLADRDTPWFSSPVIRWIRPDELLVAGTVEARRGLFSLSTRSGVRTELIRSDAKRSQFTVSGGGDTVAWAEQAVGRPPEVYVRTDDGEPRRLTHLNGHLSDRRWPEVRREVWHSPDDTKVEGWLLLPPDYRPDAKYPLLVVVHGGPGYPVPDAFRPYSFWPYPLTMLAERGYAVLLPNYRGTGTYGRAFRNPSAPDREPVQDILTGIDHLLEEGIADSTRVGIMGHSHGAWLGPMVVAARPEQFEAASFAEGWANNLSLYGQMNGWLNRRTHEPNHGGSLYDRPQRYMQMSVVLREGVRSTPTLLEAGQNSAAVQWMEYAKALWRKGTAHEFVIYPDAGHNLRRPPLKLDAMRRNLEWWARWIRPGPSSGH